MMSTAMKQMTIATISSKYTRSLRKQKAKSETQNGLVDQKTMMSEIGAIVAAMLISRKLIYPVTMRQKSAFFFVLGNCLIGLTPTMAHQMIATVIASKFRSRLKSAALNPSSAMIR